MAFKKKTFKDNLRSKELKYSDPFFELKAKKTIFEDSFPLLAYEALKEENLIDTKTNNYSELFLTDKKTLSSWVDFKDNILSASDGNSDTVVTDIQISVCGMKFTLIRPHEISKGAKVTDAFIVYDNENGRFGENVFSVRFVNTQEVQIYFEGDLGVKYYLAPIFDESGEISWLNEEIETDFPPTLTVGFTVNPTTWKYITSDREPNKLEIYTLYNNMVYKLDADGASYIVDENSLEQNRLTLIYTGAESFAAEEDTEEKTYIYVERTNFVKELIFNQSWASYEQSTNTVFINLDRSIFNIPTQYLLHVEYNDDDSVNFFPLKNNVSYRGHSIRGDYYTTETENDYLFPNVNFRTYTSISSGFKQELGRTNLLLNYMFHTNEIEVGAGQTINFTIPSTKENGGVDPLYHDVITEKGFQLNINNCRFIENGAFASDSPLLSDKFSRFQGEHSRYFNTERRGEGSSWDYNKYFKVSDIALHTNSDGMDVVTEYDNTLYLELSEVIKSEYDLIIKQIVEEGFNPEKIYFAVEKTTDGYAYHIEYGYKNAEGKRNILTDFDAKGNIVKAIKAQVLGKEKAGVSFTFEQNYSPVATVNNGTYLCTWLYTPDIDSKERPVWKDRFYYPDLVSRSKALAGNLTEHFDPSYENAVNKNLSTDSEEYKGFVNNTYYDIDSNLVLEENNTYSYTRVSKGSVNGVLDTLADKRVTKAFTKRNEEINISSSITFDNESWIRVKTVEDDEDENVKELNINFDMEIDSQKSYGIQILGNECDHGLTIQNRKDLAPYHYFFTENAIIMMNNYVEEKHRFNINEKFPSEKIVDYRLGDMFENILLVTEKTEAVKDYTVKTQFLYILSFDLKIISRMSYAPKKTTSKKIVETAEKLRDRRKKYAERLAAELEREREKELQENPDLVEDEIEEATVAEEEYNITDLDASTLSDFIIPFISLPEDEETETILNEVQKSLSVFKYEDSLFNLSLDTLFGNGSVFYKNNLFIPYVYEDKNGKKFNKILKLIFTPSTDKETELIERASKNVSTDNIVGYIRVLDEKGKNGTPECYISIRQFSDNNSKFQRYIKSVYIDKDDIVYGTQFDQVNMTFDGDSIIGINTDTLAEEETKEFDYYFVYYQSLEDIRKNGNEATLGYYMLSDKRITHMRTDIRGNLSLIREELSVDGYTKQKVVSKRVWEIYDKNKKQIFYRDITFLHKVWCVDAYNIVDARNDNNEFGYFLMFGQQHNFNVYYSYNVDNGVSGYSSYLVFNDELAMQNFKCSTNTESLIRHVTEDNYLYFNLNCLSKRWPFARRLTIPMNLSPLKRASYNINVLVDFNESIFEVRVNDKKIGKIYHDESDDIVYYEDMNGVKSVDERHQFYKRGVNLLSTSISHQFYIGTIAKNYITTLNDILENGELGNDPYSCKNTTISNLSIYKKHLALYEFLAMKLENKRINPIVLTLPCGWRNGTDEIVRFFRYNSNPNVSNNIRINISGSTLEGTKEIEELKSEIMNELADKVDALAIIKDINVID